MEFEPTEDMLAIMAEIDADPRSKFFGRQARIGTRPALDTPLTGGEPFLTSAERKLIRAYREDFSHSRYTDGVMSLASSHWGQAHIFPSSGRYRASHKQVELQPRQSRGRQCYLSAREALAESVAVIYSDGTQVAIALEEMSRTKYVTSEKRLSDVLRDGLSSIHRYFAALNLGLHSYLRGDLIRTVQFAETAHALRRDQVWAQLMRLLALLRLGQMGLYRDVVSQLKDFDQKSVELGLRQLLAMLRLQSSCGRLGHTTV